jgi:hypothetical protein
MSYDRAIADTKRFTQGTWGCDITLTAPAPGSEVAVIRGFSSIHHFNIDPDTGNPVNSVNAHISFPESVILDANPAYPTRRNGEIYIKDHLASFADAAGNVGNFQIDEQFPNETFDLIVCILGVYAN